jgi:hypothetical protein
MLLDAEYLILDAEYLILDAGYLILDTGYLILDTGECTGGGIQKNPQSSIQVFNKRSDQTP